jgi:phosphoribosylaminoimidazolecarboxamide formyltransferase / IMP cyclohydrolase
MISQPRAIISVYDKTNLDLLINYLFNQNYIIYSTGGTYKQIKSFMNINKIDSNRLISISDFTEYSEICNGRVKTLHPKIYGGILSLPDNNEHIHDLNSINGVNFNLVVVNLYPFSDTLNKTNNFDEIIEQVDIGGHTLLRASIKNYKNIITLCDPDIYQKFIDNKLTNLEYAKISMANVMKYDIEINNWFQTLDNSYDNILGSYYTPYKQLKYGLNPYMKPSYLMTKNNNEIPYKILNGNPGYINLLDASNSIRLVLESSKLLKVDCCTSFKHTSPAGVSISISDNFCDKTDKSMNHGEIVFLNCRHIDPKSSFGDFIAFSGTVNLDMANRIKKYVSDGIIAKDYTKEALEILKTKKTGNYIILKQNELVETLDFRDMNGATLVQPSNDMYLYREELLEMIQNQGITKEICPSIIDDMILGFITLKYTQSNSVCFVYRGNVIGIGAGQQNRVDCTKIAGNKAREWLIRNNISLETANLVLVSDAFLPFPDNIDVAKDYHVKYVLQPGGSIRDNQIEQACNLNNILMIYNNKRVFTH